ncbi:MAG: EamA family transporter, partial [Alphaproteobacteria bacterium]
MSQPQIPTAGPAGRSDTMRGMLWMLGAVAGLAGVAISVRALKPDIDTLELLFLRALIGLVVITAVALPRGWRTLMTKRPGLHLVRNMVHIGAQYCVFYAII